jgi:RNA polymerase sigma-70 factor, ECF subfamily
VGNLHVQACAGAAGAIEPRLAPAVDIQEQRATRIAIDRVRSGDPEGLQILYRLYAGGVFRCVRAIVRDHHDAEDVTQLVFAKLTNALGKYDERQVPFFAWLRRLARNLAIDYVRALRVRPVEDQLIAAEPSYEQGDECRHELFDSLATLPHDQRCVVVLRHVIGLSPGEIAERMGRTESSVHALHHRARTALRSELTARGSAPATRGREHAEPLELAA